MAASELPDRIFAVTLDAARAAGLVGRRRVLDSTPLYDAVATMDTVTLIRSAIRGLLRVADAEWETELRGLLRRDDDYAVAGKPVCDWDDRAAREALVDALARDARALLRALDGRELGSEAPDDPPPSDPHPEPSKSGSRSRPVAPPTPPHPPHDPEHPGTARAAHDVCCP